MQFLQNPFPTGVIACPYSFARLLVFNFRYSTFFDVARSSHLFKVPMLQRFAQIWPPRWIMGLIRTYNDNPSNFTSYPSKALKMILIAESARCFWRAHCWTTPTISALLQDHLIAPVPESWWSNALILLK